MFLSKKKKSLTRFNVIKVPLILKLLTWFLAGGRTKNKVQNKVFTFFFF